MKSNILGRLVTGAAIAACAACPVLAQQQPPAQGTPTPSPAPRPTVITTPGLENFDLRGPRQQTPAPSPAPAPPPTPAPAVTPPPIPAATRRPAARPTPAPTPAATRAATPAPTPTPTPQASPTAVAPTPVPAVVASPLPAPVASATPAPAPAQPDDKGYPWWVAFLAGAGTIGALGLAAWFFTRRPAKRRPVSRPSSAPPAGAPPQPGPPARLEPKPSAPLPIPQPAPGQDGPIAFELKPLAIDVSQQGVTLEYELLVGNVSEAAIEGIRVSLAMISANPDQDMWVEAFHAQPPQPPVAGPLELAAKSGGRINGKTLLTHDRIHVVEVGGRPMFVPIVMIDARYRGGLSIRQTGSDYMVGTEGEGMKLGPIWLDRGAQRHTKVAANRYVRKSGVQAAE